MNIKFLFKAISFFMINTLLFTRAENIDECNELKDSWYDNIKQCKSNDIGKAYYLILEGEINQELIDKIATFSELNTLHLIFVPLTDELDFKPLRKLNKVISLCFDNEMKGEYNPLRVRNKVIKYFPNLTRISFYHVIIGKSALDEIGTLAKLQSIEIHKTTFDEDASLHSFKSLSNLTKLLIDSYKQSLKRISTSLNYLTNLENLEIRAHGADFAFLTHSSLKNLKNLKYLDVSNDIGLNLDKIGYLTNLILLYLDCQNIKSLPESIGNLKKLKELSLYDNPITTLPNTIGDLESLEDLYLADNNIESIPETIGNLKNLRILNLGRNKITEIPLSIGNLTNLEQLSLDNNQIKIIPDTIGNLKKLDHVSFVHNEIESIPDSIGNLHNLINLSLSFNKIQSIPDSIGNLEKLKYLNLNNNNITSIPDSIKNSNTIKVLNLSNNPIKEE